jgi:superfamily II DNA/RNA helicase
MWYALAEFVDNSTQSRVNYGSLIDDVLKSEGKPLQIDIRYNKLTRELRVEDIVLALRIIAANRGKRALVFHEDIEACEAITHVLKAHGVPAGVYHSRLGLKIRAEMLSKYRKGVLQVLVTCRALDEGFNVPETELGIIAASTATRRQRIQRLGRILRPAAGKEGAVVYTLVATGPEINRLKEEEAELDGIAEVTWGRACPLWKVRSRRLRRFGASAAGSAGMNESPRIKRAVIIPTAHCRLRSECPAFQGQHPDSCAAHAVATQTGFTSTRSSVLGIGGTGSRTSSTSLLSASVKRKVGAFKAWSQASQF